MKLKYLISFLLINLLSIELLAVDYLDNPQQFKEEQLQNVDKYTSTINEMLAKAKELLTALNIPNVFDGNTTINNPQK